jgi:hypothetical protein
MKTAYLILAHQQPRQVARLIQSLSSEWSYFFVHVDRKASLPAFKAGHSAFAPRVLPARYRTGKGLLGRFFARAGYPPAARLRLPVGGAVRAVLPAERGRLSHPRQ